MRLPSIHKAPGSFPTIAKGKLWVDSACSSGRIPRETPCLGLCDPALPHSRSFPSSRLSHLWVLLMFVGMPINLELSEQTGFGEEFWIQVNLLLQFVKIMRKKGKNYPLSNCILQMGLPTVTGELGRIGLEGGLPCTFLGW